MRAQAGVRALIVSAGLTTSLATSFAAFPAFAQEAKDPRDARIEQLEATVRALVDKVSTLEARSAAGAPMAANPGAAPAPAPAPALAAPTPSAGGLATITAGKPSIQSADGRFSATLHAVMQFDAANYSQRTPGPIATDLRRGAAAADTAHARDLSSGSNFRRGRIGVDGKAFGDFEYNVLFEFGGAGEEDAGHIQELWVQYSGKAPFHARIGAYPPSVGMEDQGPTNAMLFLERPAVADIARGLAGGDFREAASLWAAGERWYASGSVSGRVVGVVNSQATGVSQPFDSQLGFLGRATFLPVKTDDAIVQLGVHGSYVARPADAGGPDALASAARYGVTLQERPELRVDGTRLISTGAINAQHATSGGIEAAAQYRSLFIQAEYEHFTIERRTPAAGLTDPNFDGFYVEGSWLLTGEKRRFNPGVFAFDAPLVDHPLSAANNTWGALEFAARYSTVDLNYHAGSPGAAPAADAVRGGEQTITTAGFNWYLNAMVRFMLDYQDVKVDRLSPSAATFSTPAGAQIGQHYRVIMLRSQLNF